MTMDLYGHLIDQNLWDAAKRVGDATGDTSGTSEASGSDEDADDGEEDTA